MEKVSFLCGSDGKECACNAGDPCLIPVLGRSLKEGPQFVMIHTVKGFIIVSGAEVDVFLEFPCFFCDPAYVGNLISGSCFF